MTHPAWNYPPLLRPGDRMSLDEFLDRWNRMPELKCAELIDGTVYMPSPVSKDCWLDDSRIQGICSYYAWRTPGTESGTNGTWLLPSDAAPQPDCSLSIAPQHGGRSTVRNGLAAGVPEFVSEICYSSRAYDLGPKLALYQSAGVNEYLAVLVEERRFEWRVLVNGSFQLLEPEAGTYRSRIFPGLWINDAAFWNDGSEALLKTLDEGIASQTHQDFARILQNNLSRQR